MEVKTFFDEQTYTLTYVVFDATTLDAVIIDPVLDYDPVNSVTSKESLRLLTEFVAKKRLKVHYVLETHAHAEYDSFSGSRRERKEEIGAADSMKQLEDAARRIGGNTEE